MQQVARVWQLDHHRGDVVVGRLARAVGVDGAEQRVEDFRGAAAGELGQDLRPTPVAEASPVGEVGDQGRGPGAGSADL